MPTQIDYGKYIFICDGCHQEELLTGYKTREEAETMLEPNGWKKMNNPDRHAYLCDKCQAALLYAVA